MHVSLPLFNSTQWKDKCASYSFTNKTLTHSICQVSSVVKNIHWIELNYITVHTNLIVSNTMDTEQQDASSFPFSDG